MNTVAKLSHKEHAESVEHENTLFTQEKRIIEGFIILKSSKRHYHVIFNRTVTWAECIIVVAWACLLTHSIELMQWLVMQILKGSCTLRIGKEGEKPSPRIVFRFGKQDKEIESYLKWRRENRKV
jgi:hypothetical protein